MLVIVMVVMVMVVMVMVVMVMVVMVMAVMVMVVVVEMTIEKRGLMECMHYEKFASFSNSILHMVTPASHCHNSALMGKVQGRQPESIGSNRKTVETGIIYVGYGCTESFPDGRFILSLVVGDSNVDEPTCGILCITSFLFIKGSSNIDENTRSIPCI